MIWMIQEEGLGVVCSPAGSPASVEGEETGPEVWVIIPILIALCSVCPGPLLEDWDIISPKDVIGSDVLLAEKRSSLTTAALPFTQSILTQVFSGTLGTQLWLEGRAYLAPWFSACWLASALIPRS